MVDAHSNVEFIGEINEHEKARFLGKAVALLFPIDWPEPFGLVMIEAMSCGTPVIAFRRASVPEVIKEGLSGFIVDTVEEAVAAVRRVADLDRSKIRAEFEHRFTAERMARNYSDIYQELVAIPTSSVRARRMNSGGKTLHAAQGIAARLPITTAPPIARGSFGEPLSARAGATNGGDDRRLLVSTE